MQPDYVEKKSKNCRDGYKTIREIEVEKIKTKLEDLSASVSLPPLDLREEIKSKASKIGEDEKERIREKVLSG